MARSIPTDSWAKLVTSNYHGVEGRNGEVGQQLEHVPFSLLLGDRAEVTRFRAVIRAFEIRVAHIDIPRRADQRGGKKRMDGLRDFPALPSPFT